MFLEKLINVLKEMDIDNIGLNKKLESDLGMDSQEILCLSVELEKTFDVKFADGEIMRNFSVLDLAALISRKLADRLPQGQFEGRLIEDTCIEVNAKAVHSALFDVALWSEKLPHVEKINLNYDDGFYQDFLMDVVGEDGKIISVRSIRRCTEDQISFFQPTPPKFLKHHCGEWFIRTMSDDLTHITTIHRWNYLNNSVENEEKERINNLLKKHARFALESWKNILERKQ